MSDTRVSDALRKAISFAALYAAENPKWIAPGDYGDPNQGISVQYQDPAGVHAWLENSGIALLLALELEQQVESLRAERDAACQAAKDAGESIGILPCAETSLSGLICGIGDKALELQSDNLPTRRHSDEAWIRRTEALTSERDTLLADKERLVECLGKIGLACAENDLNEAYHWFYTAVVKDFNLPAEEQAALTRKALDAARKPVC